MSDLPIRYEDLFRAPEKDGAVVSVRVHKGVKDLLVVAARREGLRSVSELLRYLIAGYILGHYNVVKPDHKPALHPIYLNISINKGPPPIDLEDKASEVDSVIEEVENFIVNAKSGLVVLKGNNYIGKLLRKISKASRIAHKYGMRDAYERLRALRLELAVLARRASASFVDPTVYRQYVEELND